ncbi:MAG: tetratricopeptide repeat protein [Candidatus Scalindua sp.]|jgi:tetratricopeptide (TPR) repeat protein|nr:tetratricopeptide repeat protein [Candidatus Scalindua sp.]MBT6231588.1 tetratricopeptide repeat protein [Candidatus Scalindua sp.]
MNNISEGERLFAEGKIIEAKELFLMVLENGNSCKETYNNLAIIAIKENNIESAIEYFTKALEIDPFYKTTVLNYTDLLRTMEKPEIALPLLESFTKQNPQDKEIQQLLAEIKLKYITVDDIKKYNEDGTKYLGNNEFEKAKKCYVKSLALNDNQPAIRKGLLLALDAILKHNISETNKNITSTRPNYFDKEKEVNPKRKLFLKYVPEKLVTEKTGLNILFISDFHVAGNQARMMKFLNNHTTHKARSIGFIKDYLNYGEDIVLDTNEHLKEVHELIKIADFFHFIRLKPNIPEIDLNKYVRKDNCMIDYFGSEISCHKEKVVDFHRQTDFFGLNKYDHDMYKGAEFMMYHIPTMFDASEYDTYETDLSFYKKQEIIIGHSPTNPNVKGTQYILPIIERVNKKIQQRVKVNLTMGKVNTEAMKEKEKCDIHINSINTNTATYRNVISGKCSGQSPLESLAMGKVTISSLDNFYLSFYPDAPIFTSTIEDLENLIIKILSNPEMVKEKMKNTKLWLKQFSPPLVIQKYLYIYQYIITGSQYVNSTDRFFKTFP